MVQVEQYLGQSCRFEKSGNGQERGFVVTVSGSERYPYKGGAYSRYDRQKRGIERRGHVHVVCGGTSTDSSG